MATPVASSNGPATNDSLSKKAKKKKNPATIETVFNQVSVFTAANINPPAGKILLTPRSAEVCLKLGVNPEVLKVRDIDSFWEPGIDPMVQRMRHEAYVQRRHDMMKQCRLERKKLINSELDKAAKFLEPGAPAAAGGSSTVLSSEMIMQQEAEKGSAMIEMEKARIKKMQARQQKELEQMIEFEINRAKVQEDMTRKIQEGKKKEELILKQAEKRLRLMGEERRLKDLQKVAMEEAEEAKRREMAKVSFEQERKLQEALARKREKDRKKAREDEIEKKRLHEEHQRQVAKFFSDHQMELRRRMESMQGADKKKQDALLERQQKTLEENRIKRAAAEERLRKNFEMSQMVEEKRKNDFLDSQSKFEAKRAITLAEQERERQLHAQEVMLQEQRRQMLLIQSNKQEERRKEMMLASFEEEGNAIEIVRVQREKELALTREKKALKMQMKAENVDRVARMKEYERMQTLKKIEDTEKYFFPLWLLFIIILVLILILIITSRRTGSMVSMKNKLIEDRRNNAAKTKQQKDAIAKVMEEVRSNASKANKIITQALTGKISLATLTGSTSPEKKKKNRSQSAPQLKPLDQSATMRTLPDLGQSSTFKTSGSNEPETLIKPYISPYDGNFADSAM